MISLKDVIKKISFAECMTLLFIFSVGLSLIYKYGFYSELGIGWYLTTASPQELLISSISYICACLIGIGLGYLAVKGFEEFIIAIMVAINIIFILIFISQTFAGGMLTGELSLTLYFTICMIYITKSPNRFEKGVLVNFDGEDLSKSKKLKFIDRLDMILMPFFSIFMFVFPFIILFIQGGMDAKALTAANQKKNVAGINSQLKVNYVQLKDDNNKWFLIEMRGDKVLIKKDSISPIFKIVEYKDIDIYSAK